MSRKVVLETFVQVPHRSDQVHIGAGFAGFDAVQAETARLIFSKITELRLIWDEDFDGAPIAA